MNSPIERCIHTYAIILAEAILHSDSPKDLINVRKHALNIQFSIKFMAHIEHVAFLLFMATFTFQYSLL